MRIQTNVSALQAQRAMSEHSKQVENSSGKLAQGTRVRSASDDAASLSIGTKHSTNIRSQNQAIRNANDAVSEFQIAEGAMGEVSSMLVRLKELSIQASTDTLQNSDRELLNLEYMALRREIERTIQTTRNASGLSLKASSSDTTRDFQIGTSTDANSRMSVNTADLSLSEFNMSIVDSSIPTSEEARLNLNYIDQAIQKVAHNRANIGALQGRLQNTINNLDTSKLNESAANSQRMDTDYAYETSEKIRAEQKLSAATVIAGQANNLGASALKLLK